MMSDRDTLTMPPCAFLWRVRLLLVTAAFSRDRLDQSLHNSLSAGVVPFLGGYT
jgi:hypothetical protein